LNQTKKTHVLPSLWAQELPGVLRLLARVHGAFLTTTVLNVDYNPNKKLRVVRVSAAGVGHSSNHTYIHIYTHTHAHTHTNMPWCCT